MAQSVEHIVHIDGVVGSSPTVTTRAEAVENQRLLLLCLHPGVHCPGVVFVGVNGSVGGNEAAFVSINSDIPNDQRKPSTIFRIISAASGCSSVSLAIMASFVS